MDSAAIVAEARTYIGTPFQHQARLKGVGVDCIGVIVGVAHTLGISEFDTVDYARQPDPSKMGAALNAHLDRVNLSDIRPGDILWLRMTREPMHVAIVTETDPLRIVHALSRAGVSRCVEQGIDDAWRRRIVACFRYRGVA